MPWTRETSYTCDFIDVIKADKWGMVPEVVAPDQLMDPALAMAKRIATHPPVGICLAKSLIRDSQDMPLGAVLEMVAGMEATLQQTEDHHEALDAVLEGRDPVYKRR